jgi:ketopantoate hydroxymethyltransferase
MTIHIDADQYCDSCLTVAHDYVGDDSEAQVKFLESAGPHLDDHECDATVEYFNPTYPDQPLCACPSHGWN